MGLELPHLPLWAVQHESSASELGSCNALRTGAARDAIRLRYRRSVTAFVTTPGSRAQRPRDQRPTMPRRVTSWRSPSSSSTTRRHHHRPRGFGYHRCRCHRSRRGDVAVETLRAAAVRGVHTRDVVAEERQVCGFDVFVGAEQAWTPPAVPPCSTARHRRGTQARVVSSRDSWSARPARRRLSYRGRRGCGEGHRAPFRWGRRHANATRAARRSNARAVGRHGRVRGRAGAVRR